VSGALHCNLLYVHSPLFERPRSRASPARAARARACCGAGHHVSGRADPRRPPPTARPWRRLRSARTPSGTRPS
jgi:hypothetical protein